MNSFEDTQYVIKQKLGEGGMGTVYLGEDILLKRKVAVKVLNRSSSSGLEILDERFQQEALALARLNHPNITHLYSFLPKDNSYWMVMEYLTGESLEQWIRNIGYTTPVVAVSIVIQLLDGLHHAHKKGIIHRDLKPANVMISEEGEVKIMDFGIARIRDSQRITQHGKSVGTLQYMAPEQIKGLEGDERTDIYATGTILYELLSGTPPFQSSTDYHLMKAKLEDNALALPSSVPADLNRVIIKAIDKNPENRYQNVMLFKEALERCFRNRLLRDNELLTELCKPPVKTAESLSGNASVSKQLADVSANLKRVSGNVNVKSFTDIKFRPALLLLLAVIIICGTLLFWNSTRQQVLAENTGASLPKEAAMAVPPPEGETRPKTQEAAINQVVTVPSEDLNNSAATPAVVSPKKNTDSSKRKPEIENNTGKEPDLKGSRVESNNSNTGKSKEPGTIIGGSVQPITSIKIEPNVDTTSTKPKDDDKSDTTSSAANPTPVLVMDEELNSETIDRRKRFFKLHCTGDLRDYDGRVMVKKGAEVTGEILNSVSAKKAKRAMIEIGNFRTVNVTGRKIDLEFRPRIFFANETNGPAVIEKDKTFAAKLRR